ncbi:RND family efflux transporter, MFP subunit [Leptolyngbyaceae cyanobacterium JSC-12]|nr:RND family efflux transporter, MFP subunit [Leptolyngbyaceae cyanobacterium JSC-12]
MKDLRKLKVPRWVLPILVLGLVGLGGYIAYSQMQVAQRQERQRRVQTVTVERENLPVIITANGVIQPERSVNVSPKSSGVLKDLLVKEGDRVEQEQILAYMDASNLQGQLTQAKGQLASAQASLQKALAGNRTQDVAQAEARVRDAEAALRQAEQNYQQNQQLYTTGAISQREYNTSLADRDRAIAQLNLAKQALSLQQAGSRPEDVAQARAEVTWAEGQLQTIQAQINDTVIRAPFSGVVTRKFADPGSFVTPTTSGSSVSSATSSSILALAANNQVVAKVAETSIPKIKLGQRVTITADAYPDQTFTGRVTQIATQSTVEQNVTNFEVKMAIADPKNQLKAGMNVNVEFNVGTLTNALVIPTVAIVRREEGTGVLLANQGEGKSRFQAIKTGATVNDKTVVTEGLESGQKVLLSFPVGERPPSRTPSIFPGMGGGQRGGGQRSSGDRPSGR